MFVKEEALSWMCLVFVRCRQGQKKALLHQWSLQKAALQSNTSTFLPKSCLFSSIYPCLMPSFNPPPAPLYTLWLVSVYQWHLRLTHSVLQAIRTHWGCCDRQAGRQAVIFLWQLLAAIFQTELLWPFLWWQNWVCQSWRTSSSRGDFATTLLPSLSHSRSDSVWQGSSILINLIISCWKKKKKPPSPPPSCTLSPAPATVRLLRVTTHPRVSHHLSSYPVTLKAVFLFLTHPSWDPIDTETG